MLAISTKYALMALRELAKDDGSGFVQVNTLSKKVSVPGPYLSKIIKVLAAKGIVDTKKGLSGGVRLLQSNEPSFLDVCIALDDPIIKSQCILSKGGCDGKRPCAMHNEWKRIRENVLKFLDRSKIND